MTPPVASGPTFDQRLFALERRFVAASLAVMGAAVFLDVVHRVASRDQGLVARLFGDAAWTGPAGTALGLATALVFVGGALRARGRPAGVATWARAAVVVAVGYGLLRAFLALFANGLVWSQTLALVLMLWVACVGASMAAHQGRHLALDIGAKVWPKRALPAVQGLGNVVTATFCVIMAALAVVSLRSHYGDYVDTGGAGGVFTALPIPKWIAFAAIPVAFAIMGARFLLQAALSFRGRIDDDDPLRQLGLTDDAAPGRP